MPRRFRLSVPKKNEERKACGRTVLASHVTLTQGDLLVATSCDHEDEMKVSIPINLLWQSEAPTLARLQARLKTLPALPHGKFCASVMNGI